MQRYGNSYIMIPVFANDYDSWMVMILKKMLVIILMSMIVLLTACTSAEYKKAMSDGEQALTDNRYEEAISAFSAAAEEEPEQQEAKDGLEEAERLLMESNFKIAIEQGQKAYNDKKYSQAVSIMLKVRNEYKDIAEAKELIAEIDELIKQVTIQNRIIEGKRALEDKRFDVAISAFSFVLDEKPNEQEIKDLLDIAKKGKEEYLALLQKEKEEHERKVKEALTNLKSEYDEVQGITWYYHKNEYPIIREFPVITGLYLYIGKEDKYDYTIPFIRFVTRYYGDSWVFYEKVIFRIDDEIYTFQVEPKRSNGNGKVWEWEDVAFDNQKYQLVKQIINSEDDVIMRFQGDEYYTDIRLTDSSKRELQEMLYAFEGLGGSLSQYE
jgi:tetratricopeptide (TPR) repeat protein